MKRIAIMFLVFIAVLAFWVGSVHGQSLWSQPSSFNTMYTSGYASRVGDILTIIIAENNRATEVADAEAKRKTSLSGKLSGFIKERIAGKLFGHKKDKSIDFPEFILDGKNDFKGETELERSNTFTARVAAKIVMVDDNGNFLIEARKTINIGKETKSIVMSGTVRPNDITSENTVLSTQIADAQISYEGGGPVTNMANPGVFTRLLTIFF